MFVLIMIQKIHDMEKIVVELNQTMNKIFIIVVIDLISKAYIYLFICLFWMDYATSPINIATPHETSLYTTS